MTHAKLHWTAHEKLHPITVPHIHLAGAQRQQKEAAVVTIDPFVFRHCCFFSFVFFY